MRLLDLVRHAPGDVVAMPGAPPCPLAEAVALANSSLPVAGAIAPLADRPPTRGSINELSSTLSISLRANMANLSLSLLAFSGAVYIRSSSLLSYKHLGRMNL